MNIDKEIKKIEETEKAFLKQIDDENILEKEIDDIAKYTAEKLSKEMAASFTIQNRTFIVIASTYNDHKNIQLVAREKTKIDTPNAKIIRADLEMDLSYTKQENLIVGIKALLGHITGYLKPEAI